MSGDHGRELNPDALTDFIGMTNRLKKVTPFRGCLLALDPGETTGFAVFRVHEKAGVVWDEIDQVKTWPESDAVGNLTKLLDEHRPDLIVWESYRVYSWKSDDHKWSSVRTAQVIGCAWTLAVQRKIPWHVQSAQNAKGFWTDERLQEFGLYLKGLRHGRDATRHALHYLCFGK